jgi:DNA-binding transcriptional ArsR family regulator
VSAGTRRWLAIGATLLVGIAAAGNVGHTYTHAINLGQQRGMALVIACLPDVMLILCVLRLRHDRGASWAWLGLAASALLVGWASIATAGTGLGAKVIAVAPMLAAVIAAGLIEGGPGGPSLEQVQADAGQALVKARHEAAQQLARAHREAQERLTAALEQARDEAHDQVQAQLRQAHDDAEERLTAALENAALRAAAQQAGAVAAARADEQHQAGQRLAHALDQAHRAAREQLQQALTQVGEEEHARTVASLRQAHHDAGERLTAAVEEARGKAHHDAEERLTAAVAQAHHEAEERLTATVGEARRKAHHEAQVSLRKAHDDAEERLTAALAEADARLTAAVAEAVAETRREATATAMTRQPAAAGAPRTGRMRLVDSPASEPVPGPDTDSPLSDSHVLAALQAAHDPVTPQQLQQQTGLAKATVSRALARLRETGHVAAVRRGFYQSVLLPDDEPGHGPGLVTAG